MKSRNFNLKLIIENLKRKMKNLIVNFFSKCRENENFCFYILEIFTFVISFFCSILFENNSLKLILVNTVVIFIVTNILFFGISLINLPICLYIIVPIYYLIFNILKIKHENLFTEFVLPIILYVSVMLSILYFYFHINIFTFILNSYYVSLYDQNFQNGLMK